MEFCNLFFIKSCSSIFVITIPFPIFCEFLIELSVIFLANSNAFSVVLSLDASLTTIISN